MKLTFDASKVTKINKDAVIGSFCYNFTAALVTKLLNLWDEKKIFAEKEGNTNYKEDDENQTAEDGRTLRHFTRMTATILQKLARQTGSPESEEENPKLVADTIKHVDDFLKIFEDGPPRFGGR